MGPVKPSQKYFTAFKFLISFCKSRSRSRRIDEQNGGNRLDLMLLNWTLAATRRKPEHLKYKVRHAYGLEELNPLNSTALPNGLFGSGWIVFVAFGGVVEPVPQLFALRIRNAFRWTGLWSGSNINWNTKVKKSKISGQLSGKQGCITMADFGHIFCWRITVLNIVWIRNWIESFPKSEPEPQ